MAIGLSVLSYSTRSSTPAKVRDIMAYKGIATFFTSKASH